MISFTVPILSLPLSLSVSLLLLLPHTHGSHPPPPHTHTTPMIWSFLKRRRNAFLYTAGGALGVYLLGKYAQSKLDEWTEKAKLDRIAQEKYVPGGWGVGGWGAN